MIQLFFLQLENTRNSGGGFPTAKESTVQPSQSFVLSKNNVKQTKAQVRKFVLKPFRHNRGSQLTTEYPFFLFLIARWYYEKNMLF